MSTVFEHRRALHRIPELKYDLPLTRSYVRAALSALNCEVFEQNGGVFACFDAGRADAAAFRADMDALPITEKTGLPFASEHPGRMHACGHDAHMAMLLEFAARLSARGGDLPHNVLIIFQPAEESGGGAREISESGLLEARSVKRVFGCHIWPGLPLGAAFSRPGALMAGAREIFVSIRGKSAHVGAYEAGRDALLAGAEFIRRVYCAEREIPLCERRVLRFGRMESGEALNSISDNTELAGSMRFFSDEAHDALAAILEKTAAGLEAETGCEFNIELSSGYPPVINDTALFEAANRAFEPSGLALLPEPTAVAEDFSFYGQRVPSLFFMLGTGGTTGLHRSDFDFDESVLEVGPALFERLLELP